MINIVIIYIVILLDYILYSICLEAWRSSSKGQLGGHPGWCWQWLQATGFCVSPADMRQKRREVVDRPLEPRISFSTSVLGFTIIFHMLRRLRDICNVRPPASSVRHCLPTPSSRSLQPQLASEEQKQAEFATKQGSEKLCSALSALPAE